MRRWLPLLALGGLLVVALVVAARPKVDNSEAARVTRIGKELRCPTCRGLSVAESDAEAANAVRVFIHDRIRQGAGDSQIKAELKERFGVGILLRPPASGLSGLVWAIPVAAFVVAAGGLAYAFWRWRARSLRAASDADIVLVERARRA